MNIASVRLGSGGGGWCFGLGGSRLLGGLGSRILVGFNSEEEAGSQNNEGSGLHPSLTVEWVSDDLGPPDRLDSICMVQFLPLSFVTYPIMTLGLLLDWP